MIVEAEIVNFSIFYNFKGLIMAAFSDQKTYISTKWRNKLEEIVGKIPVDGGVQWKVGVQHLNDPEPSINSDFINSELTKAGAINGELVVVLCNG